MVAIPSRPVTPAANSQATEPTSRRPTIVVTDVWTFDLAGTLYTVTDYWHHLYAEVDPDEARCACGWLLTYDYTAQHPGGRREGMCTPALRCLGCGRSYEGVRS